ncbi:MAG: hypothetical protein ACRDRX_26915 [Pseudonocardiaceae bacterium]
MTSVSTGGVTFGQAADLLAAHLASHPLPEPASVTVTTCRAGRSEVKVQLPSCRTVAEVATALLSWADTLTGPAGAVDLDVYGAAAHDPELFTDLSPGDHRSVSLVQLRGWAASVSDEAITRPETSNARTRGSKRRAVAGLRGPSGVPPGREPAANR